MTKLDHVVARFDGADLTFRIARSDIRALEAFGTSALALIQKMTAGAWNVADVRFVLAFALAPAGKFTRLAGSLVGADATVGQAVRETIKDARVDAAFAKNPPGEYVPLALAVLAAALFGIDDAEARFTDEPADGA